MKKPSSFDGQEVENNQTNCAAYSVYSRALLTHQSGVIYRRNTKNGASAPIEYIPTPSNGFRYPIMAIHHDNVILTYLCDLMQGKFIRHLTIMRGDEHACKYYLFLTYLPWYITGLLKAMHDPTILAMNANLPRPPTMRWQKYDATHVV